MPASLAGETIGVLGLARSGLAAARLALSRGASVYASDAGIVRGARRRRRRSARLGGDAETGGHDLAKLAACDRIVLSPGIPPTRPCCARRRSAGCRWCRSWSSPSSSWTRR
jgi:UDP-N-acetylmuramoylalanine--D-glutamate ligase